MTTAPFFTGWLAQGTGTGNGFIENTASGYARQPVILSALFNGQTQMVGGVTFSGGLNPLIVSQRALYDAANGGNLITWWPLAAPVSVPAYGTDTLAAGSLAHRFPDLAYARGASVVLWVAGSQIGVTETGAPITAGVALACAAGVLEASSAAGLGGGGGSAGFPGGTGLASASGTLVTVGSGLALSGGVLSSSGTLYTFGSGLTNVSGTVSVNFGTAAGTAAQGNDARFALASSALQPAALPSATAGQLYGGSGAAGAAAAVAVGTGLSLSGGTLTATGTTLTIPNSGIIGGNGSTLTSVAVGSGLSLSGGTLTATGGGAASNSVSTIYTASGAIAPADSFSLLNGTTALSMTLANGSVDGHPLIINNYGSAASTVTLNLGGNSGTVVTLAANTPTQPGGATLNVTWNAALSTYLLTA
jgi:hypothetical protein